MLLVTDRVRSFLRPSSCVTQSRSKQPQVTQCKEWDRKINQTLLDYSGSGTSRVAAKSGVRFSKFVWENAIADTATCGLIPTAKRDCFCIADSQNRGRFTLADWLKPLKYTWLALFIAVVADARDNCVL